MESAAWSLDGQSVFLTGNPEEDADLTFVRNLYAVRIASGRRKKLCGLPGGLSDPAPSPDGKTVAFLGNDHRKSFGTNTGVYLVPSTGGRPKNISKHLDLDIAQSLNADSRAASPFFGPVWSPDGRTVKFLATVKGATHLFASTFTPETWMPIPVETAPSNPSPTAPITPPALTPKCRPPGWPKPGSGAREVEANASPQRLWTVCQL